MKIIAIGNQKGGVGKTTTTVNLAAGLVQHGKRVLCLDLDPQSNLSSCLGYEPDGQPTISELILAEAAPAMVPGALPPLKACIRHNAEGIDYLPSSLLLASADIFLAGVMMRECTLARILARGLADGDYDYLLIDCLPSLGLLLTNALAAADGLIVPVQTQKLSADGLELFLPVVRSAQQSLNPRLKVYGVLPTMCDNTAMSEAVLALLRESYGDLTFETVISRSVAAANSSNQQTSLISDAGKKREGKLGREYLAFTDEFLARAETEGL